MSILEIVGVLFIAITLGNMAYKIEQKRIRDKTIMSIKEALDLVGLPIVTFTINNIRYNFILDTGANMSTINSAVLKDITYEKTGEKDVVFGLSGEAQEAEYLNIDLEYNNKKYMELFQATDISAALDKVKEECGVTVVGLIGNSFFQKYRYILDFDALKVYSKA